MRFALDRGNRGDSGRPTPKRWLPFHPPLIRPGVGVLLLALVGGPRPALSAVQVQELPQGRVYDDGLRVAPDGTVRFTGFMDEANSRSLVIEEVDPSGMLREFLVASSGRDRLMLSPSGNMVLVADPSGAAFGRTADLESGNTAALSAIPITQLDVEYSGVDETAVYYLHTGTATSLSPGAVVWSPAATANRSYSAGQFGMDRFFILGGCPDGSLVAEGRLARDGPPRSFLITAQGTDQSLLTEQGAETGTGIFVKAPDCQTLAGIEVQPGDMFNRTVAVTWAPQTSRLAQSVLVDGGDFYGRPVALTPHYLLLEHWVGDYVLWHDKAAQPLFTWLATQGYTTGNTSSTVPEPVWGFGELPDGRLALLLWDTAGQRAQLVIVSPPGSSPPPAGGPPTPLRGDLNGDGMIDLRDATLSLQLAVGAGPPLGDSLGAVADVNQDGAIDLKDTTLILAAAVGLRSLE